MVSQNVPSGSDLHPCAKRSLLTDHGVAGASHLCHDRTSVELADIVRRRACPSSSGELLDNVRRKGEGANPSSSEVHGDIADVPAEDVRKRAGVQSLFLR